MQRFTDQGWQKIIELSNRYGVSTDAVTNMLQAVQNGGGTMAQFYISELGGGGQWMQGGMTMVGDMFNYGLKSKVDNLCSELSQLLAQQPFVPTPPASSQSQYQGGGQQQQQGGGYGQQQSNGYGQQSGGYNGGSPVSLFVPGPSGGYGSWWPGDLGSPNSSGGQNNVRYAYFSNSHRLAVDVNGQVTVYDTLDHQIGGVSQQQSGDGSVTFTSQYGTVNVGSLPLISGQGTQQNYAQQTYAPQNVAPQNFAPQTQYAPPPQPMSNNSGSGSAHEADIFAKIERLAELYDKKILSQEEYAAKKSELLSRL